MRDRAANEGGTPVKLHLAAIAIVALACSACANERVAEPIGYRQAAMHLAAPLLTPAQEVASIAPVQKKTMASKVLSAIALEEVTGRKPDPSRFYESN